jgi:hypothetical protein
MKGGFRIGLASDVDYEELIAEIYLEDKLIALLSQDKGFRALRIEFPGCELNQDAITREADLEGFLIAVQEAKTALRKRTQ